MREWKVISFNPKTFEVVSERTSGEQHSIIIPDNYRAEDKSVEYLEYFHRNKRIELDPSSLLSLTLTVSLATTSMMLALTIIVKVICG